MTREKAQCFYVIEFCKEAYRGPSYVTAHGRNFPLLVFLYQDASFGMPHKNFSLTTNRNGSDLKNQRNVPRKYLVLTVLSLDRFR